MNIKNSTKSISLGSKRSLRFCYKLFTHTLVFSFPQNELIILNIEFQQKVEYHLSLMLGGIRSLALFIKRNVNIESKRILNASPY